MDPGIQDREQREDVYWHECTHLHLFTSTAFGHAQQYLANLLVVLKDAGVSDITLRALRKFAALLHESSWEIHEGAATITPYLRAHPFSGRLIDPASYAHLPPRYANSATNIATAAGAITPVQLAMFGYVVVNAVAQYCLNTNILVFCANFVESMPSAGQADSFRTFAYLSDAGNHPSCRLYRLISRLYEDESNAIPRSINNRLYESISHLDFVNVNSDNSISLAPRNITDVTVLQDSLNFAVLSELDSILPGTLHYKHASEVSIDMQSLEKASRAIGVSAVRMEDISSNLERRVAFAPIVKEL